MGFCRSFLFFFFCFLLWFCDKASDFLCYIKRDEIGNISKKMLEVLNKKGGNFGFRSLVVAVCGSKSDFWGFCLFVWKFIRFYFYLKVCCDPWWNFLE